MNLSHFFEHWSIAENPFKGEEARDDGVFAKLGLPDAGSAGGPIAAHSDFEKILGSLVRPSTSVVFGEKGSGKTAIRMQLAEQIRLYNIANSDRGVWVIPYDGLNAVLDCLHERTGETDPAVSLASIRLVDHIDALLSIATTSVVEQIIEGSAASSPSPVPADAGKRVRKGGRELIRDLRLLQAVYDNAEQATARSKDLRRRFRAWPSWQRLLVRGLAWAGWVLPAAAAWYAFFRVPPEAEALAMTAKIAAGVLAAAWRAALVLQQMACARHTFAACVGHSF